RTSRPTLQRGSPPPTPPELSSNPQSAGKSQRHHQREGNEDQRCKSVHRAHFGFLSDVERAGGQKAPGAFAAVPTRKSASGRGSHPGQMVAQPQRQRGYRGGGRALARRGEHRG